MDISGEYRLAHSARTVWEALHDAELLTDCVPGCERIAWLDADTVEAALVLRIGAVRRRYSGRVRIADPRPWESYTLLIGETGQGSTVTSRIRLEPRGGLTAVRYDVEARLDGYLARLGTPIAIAIARRVADRFFRRLTNALDARSAQEEALARAADRPS